MEAGYWMWANKCPAIVNELRVIGPGCALIRPHSHGMLRHKFLTLKALFCVKALNEMIIFVPNILF